MTSINNIPKRYLPGLELLSSIDNETFDAIIDGLSLTQLCSSITKLADKVSTVKSLAFDTVGKFFLSVGGFMVFLEKEIKPEEIAIGVYDAIQKESAFLLKESQKEKFNNRLATLLNVKQIYYAAKAGNLIEESNNVFIQARIITDIRPIFSLNTEATPIAGVIVHNLHIHYSRDDEGDHRDIYFALNSEEVKSLKDLLIRAEKKQIALHIYGYAECLKNYGFIICTDYSIEKEYEKIAIFRDSDNIFLHAARQLEDGRWTSKIGGYEDINHVNLDVISEDSYGFPKIYMKRYLRNNNELSLEPNNQIT